MHFIRNWCPGCIPSENDRWRDAIGDHLCSTTRIGGVVIQTEQRAGHHLVRDEGVAGSNPATPTSFLYNRNRHGERYGERNGRPAKAFCPRLIDVVRVACILSNVENFNSVCHVRFTPASSLPFLGQVPQNVWCTT